MSFQVNRTLTGWPPSTSSPKNWPWPSLKRPSTGGSMCPGRLVEAHQIRHSPLAGSNDHNVTASNG
jgi:hypothetical protein